MLDDQNGLICWFDTANEGRAVGVPEGELDELMFNVSGPIAISERAYASTGRVKAVVIKHFGPEFSAECLDGVMVALRRFADRFGLEFICRAREGIDLSFNGGRYYSPVRGATAG